MNARADGANHPSRQFSESCISHWKLHSIILGLFEGKHLVPKCLLLHAAFYTPPRVISICALPLVTGIDSNFNMVYVEFGNLNGVVVVVHFQSFCGSPFLGKYIGAVTPQHFWMTFILRGKKIIVDRQGKEAKYPEKVPMIFQMAPTEDYEKDVCVQLCQTNQSNFSWESHRDYEYGACGYYDDALAQPHDLTPHYDTARQSANHGKICSIDD